VNRNQLVLITCVIVICIAIISAVCWHSVEEIHYLKTFFPKQFTVEEAYYASKVELVKIAFISFPLILIIGISLYFLNYFRKHDGK
jgi:hypothetical protein